ncbi:MAG: class I SAM-dependent methyltransferase [Candidatus Atribacteria bacterium]|nr:class I SAM-dependent methyltransferase [Candidatus Atribacteria bacterium]
MLKRIPHSDLVIIEGEKKTKDYLKMQKAMGKFYLNDFFAKFDIINSNGRFLEVGPGTGYQTVLVSEKYKPKEIIGLEYSSDMVKVATKYTEQKKLTDRIKYIVGSVENSDLVLSLGKFDIIYSTFSLHHWTDPKTGIKNLYNALDDNGVLFIYDFHREGLFYYINIKRGVWESIRASYTEEEIIKLLSELSIQNYIIRKKSLYLDFIVIKN